MDYDRDHPYHITDQDFQETSPDQTAPDFRRTRSSSTTELADKSSSDPYSYMIPQMKSLVLWKRPAHSAVALGSVLGLLLIWRWFSIFNVVCALGVFGIGINLLYVNGIMQFQTFVGKDAKNPNEKFFQSDKLALSHSEIQRRVNQFTDGLNVVVQEIIKIILVENSMRSVKYLIILYVAWTLGSWMSVNTLLSLATVSLFAFPRLYLDNQALVDEKLAQGNKLVQDKIAVGKGLAGQQLNSVYAKAQELAASKGLIKKPTVPEETKKTE